MKFRRCAFLLSRPPRVRRLAVALALAMRLAAGGAEPGVLVDRVVAWVDDEAMTLTETEDALARFQSEGAVEQGPATEARLRAALERLIDEHLILRAAEKSGIAPEAGVVENRVDATLARMAERQGGAEALERALTALGTSAEAMRERLRKRLTREWTVARAVGARFNISDDDVAAFRVRRKAAGLPLERYQLGHLFLPVSESAPAQRWAEASKLLHEARLEAIGRKDFAAAAAEFVETHREEGAQGGALGLFDPGELAPALAEAAAKLDDGALSPPVRTDRGVHVLYMERKTTSRDMLFAERFETERRRWAEALRRDASIQIVEPLIP